VPGRRLRKTPQIGPLLYGVVYCELCKKTLKPGDRVAWWRVLGVGRRERWAVYCQTCHDSNVRAGRGLR
jgi:hypothetical protein